MSFLLTDRHLRNLAVKGVLLVVILFTCFSYFLTVPFPFVRGFCCSCSLEPLDYDHETYNSFLGTLSLFERTSRVVGGAGESAFGSGSRSDSDE